MLQLSEIPIFTLLGGPKIIKIISSRFTCVECAFKWYKYLAMKKLQETRKTWNTLCDSYSSIHSAAKNTPKKRYPNTKTTTILFARYLIENNHFSICIPSEIDIVDCNSMVPGTNREHTFGEKSHPHRQEICSHRLPKWIAPSHIPRSHPLTQSGKHPKFRTSWNQRLEHSQFITLRWIGLKYNYRINIFPL